MQLWFILVVTIGLAG